MTTKVERSFLVCFLFLVLLLIGIPSAVQAGCSGIIQVSGVGSDAQGADLAIYDINGDGKQDMVLMAYDNPVGLNYFRYMIGWDFITIIDQPSGLTSTVDKPPTGSGEGVELYIIPPPEFTP